MKTLALTSAVFALTAATLMAQGKSDIEFLRARADAHERKISQLENEILRLKAFHSGEPAAPASTKATKAPAASSAVAGEYVVKKGDILTRIAYRYKTTVAAIIKENGLRNDRINIGQKLRIPGAAPAKQPTSSGRAEMVKKATPVKKSDSKHTVKSGETFYSIARQHKVSVGNLTAANPTVRPTSLRVGQKLVIDSSAEVARSKSAATSKAVAKSKPKAKAPATRDAEFVDPPRDDAKDVVRNAPADRQSSSSSQSSSEPAIRTITVNQQMTYGQFASQHGASTTQLNALNGLSLSKNTMLAKGSELYVPKF